MKKKRLITIFIILVFIILLIPSKWEAKDGGTVGYEAALYKVIKWHSISDNGTVSTKINYYYYGTEVVVLGFTVYNDAKITEARYCD